MKQQKAMLIAHRYTAQESDFSQHYNAGGSYYVC
jgi:hypothetical protein